MIVVHMYLGFLPQKTRLRRSLRLSPSLSLPLSLCLIFFFVVVVHVR